MWRYSLSAIVARKFNAGPVELAYLDEGDGARTPEAKEEDEN